MTRTESARLKSLGEVYAQKKLELHLAKDMSVMAEKRFFTTCRRSPIETTRRLFAFDPDRKSIISKRLLISSFQ